MKPFTLVVAILLPCLFYSGLSAQDKPSIPGADKVTSRYLSAVSDKSGSISNNIDRQTGKYLAKLQRQEVRLYKKLAKKDTTSAAKALADSKKQYAALQQKLAGATQKISARGKKYIPLLDSVSTSLKFLHQYGDLFKKGLASSEQVSGSLLQVNSLQDKLQQADDVQAFIKERRQLLTEQLQKAGMPDALKDFNKDAYYYSAQIKEYRDVINDPGKAEEKALALLNQLPAFRSFMQQNSQLAALFGAPGGSNITPAAAMAGLQTRVQVQQLIQSQVASGGPNAQAIVQQNIQAAQAQLNTLKDKINQLGGGSSDINIPDFKPNTQKTKTFLQRLECGGNIQTQKSGNFFPTTTDVAMTVGYKLNDRSTAGLGASYQFGWGRDIQHISLSSQGIGFRSFLDVKLKGSIWMSGGGELNYKSTFRDFKVLDDFSPWQKSALLGLTKKYKAGKKLKGNIQLLYNFLWKRQVPVTQPIAFRVGYSI